MKRNVCLVTVNRSDYGLQKNLIAELKKSRKIDFSLVVTGAHLEKKYGLSVQEIISDKNYIKNHFKMSPKKDDSTSTLLSMSSGLKKFTLTFKKIKPNLIIILGDRYEMLMAAISAFILQYPVVHIHGGELTEGAFDDSIRHAITKLSNIHFATHEIYKKRIIKLGENPKYVFNFGGLGAENIKLTKFLKKSEIEKKFNFKFQKNNFLVSLHPTTKEKGTTKFFFRELLNAIKLFANTSFIFTYPNPDPENFQIIKQLNKEVKKNKNLFVVKSLGQKNFHSIMNYIDGIIGNSSSGILEAPSFKIGTINIATRQKGRLQVKSILNCKPNKKAIHNLIKKVLSKEFKYKIRNLKNIYQKRDTAKKIVKKLENIPLQNLQKKIFYE